MAIAFDHKLPFRLLFITEYDDPRVSLAERFCCDYGQFLLMDIVSAEIEENDNVSILFDSADRDARFYLEALDSIPASPLTRIDGQGRYYRMPSEQKFALYRNCSGGEYCALRVGIYRIIVEACGKQFFGALRVRPKQLSHNEWSEMIEELESESAGLAREFGKSESRQPTDGLTGRHERSYRTLKKHTGSLLRIFGTADDRILPSGGAGASRSCPAQKRELICKTARLCRRELDEILSIAGLADVGVSAGNGEAPGAGDMPDAGELRNFIPTARRLRLAAAGVCRRYRVAGNSNGAAGAMPDTPGDAECALLAAICRTLAGREPKSTAKMRFSGVWKTSSNLYERWCFMKIYHMFRARYKMLPSVKCEAAESGSDTADLYDWERVSFLRGGDIRLDLVYDRALPISGDNTDSEIHPLWIRSEKAGFRPDILINIFEYTSGRYFGSIVLECKYRKFKSFWESTLSSKEQIISYQEKSRSKFYLSERIDVRPVQKVFVLNPDLGGVERESGTVVISRMRPKDETSLAATVDAIDRAIESACEIAVTFNRLLGV